MSITRPEGVTSIGCAAFSGCENLVSVYIPKSLYYIDIFAFMGDYKLSAVHISSIESWCNVLLDGNDYLLHMAKNLYLNGELIKDLIIPNTVTAIESSNFMSCSITSAAISESMKNIGDYAF